MLLSCLVRLCVRVFVCMHPPAPPLPAHTLQANMPKVTRTEKLQAPNAAGRKRRNGGQRRPTGVAAQAHTVGAVASLLDQLATFEPPTLEPRHGGLDAGGFGSRHHRETLDAAERGPALHAALKVGGAPFTATAARVRLTPLVSLVALMALVTCFSQSGAGDRLGRGVSTPVLDVGSPATHGTACGIQGLHASRISFECARRLASPVHHSEPVLRTACVVLGPIADASPLKALATATSCAELNSPWSPPMEPPHGAPPWSPPMEPPY